MTCDSRFVRSFVLVASTIAVASAAGRARWHVEAGPSLWQGAEVTYGANLTPEPSAAPRTDRTYDDGFNRVDASGNVGDGPGGALASRTGNFGFNNDSQVNVSAGTLALHLLQTAPGTYIGNRSTSDRPGIDISLRLSLASASAKRDWGVELGADFARFRQTTNAPQTIDVRLLTDTYALGGVVPQRAPYAGRFSPLPGDQRIGDTPTRTISTTIGSVSGTHAFRARTELVRLGGWIELLPAATQPAQSEMEHWSVLAHAGPALLVTRASFEVDERIETVAFPGTSVRVTNSGSRSRTDVAGFAGVKVRRSLGESCALLAWADYVSGSKLTVAGGSRFARLDLSSTYLLGLAFEFQWGRR